MAYFPVFRGKQFELVCLRENAARMAQWGMSPIIEPVKDSVVPLVRALRALNSAGVQTWVMSNPLVGDLRGQELHSRNDELAELVKGANGIRWVFQVSDDIKPESLTEFLIAVPDGGVFHHGSIAAVSVAKALENARLFDDTSGTHFFREKCNERYRIKFKDVPSIAIEDGFKKQQKNILYPDDEVFSDLLLVYEAKGFTGFGDYLIVGDDYTEGGGPAMAVAIHLTYKNLADDGAIHIRHFVSDSNLSADDPAGKFREALEKLVRACEAPASMIAKTSAVKEFMDLHSSGHFPGLGYVKKLSLQHHLELIGE